MRVEVLQQVHAQDVLAVYQAGLDGGQASFELQAPAWEAWDAAHLPGHRLVAVERGQVLGWAALSPVSVRSVYRGVAETSVYVDPRAQGRGAGRALLEALVDGSERDGLWTLQAGVFPENAASLALHASVGFRVVGRRERLAQHRGTWRDVLLLERRSPLL